MGKIKLTYNSENLTKREKEIFVFGLLLGSGIASLIIACIGIIPSFFR